MLVTQNSTYRYINIKILFELWRNAASTEQYWQIYTCTFLDNISLLMAVESLKHFTCYFVCLFISFYFTFIQQFTAKFTNPSACELRKSRGNSIRRHFVGLRKRERKGIVDTVKSEWNQARKTLIHIK